MAAIKKTNYFSWNAGKLAKGCKLCAEGKKLVLFVTGLCEMNCGYCPLSEQKKQRDIVFANEWKIVFDKDILEEAELCKSEGAGITGGDPLLKFDRVVKYIEILKERFGKKFHIHLYCPLVQVTDNRLNRLSKLGLDEIRFHPDLDNSSDWSKIKLAKKYDFDVGIEIPVIPDKKEQTIKLINYIAGKVNFINLNELEISDTNAQYLTERGFKTKDSLSYAIDGSETLAKELLKYCTKKRLPAHFCTAKLKDKCQLTKRIKHRAKNTAKSYEVVDKCGTLIKGVAYLPDLVPSFGYSYKLLKFKDKKKILDKLKKAKQRLQRNFDIPPDLIEIDYEKLRILTAPWIVRDLKNKIKKLKLRPAVVEEYPTKDQMEVDIEFV